MMFLIAHWALGDPVSSRMKPTMFCERCGCWKLPNEHRCSDMKLIPPVRHSSLIPPPPPKTKWVQTTLVVLAILAASAGWSFLCYNLGAIHAKSPSSIGHSLH